MHDRVIDSIAVDGVPILDWQSKSLQPYIGAVDVHIETKTIVQLLEESLRDTSVYLRRLVDGALLCATRLQQAREQEALGLVEEIIGGIQWYSEVLAHVASLRPSVAGETSGRLVSMNGILEASFEALQANDYTLVADLLEYELVPELQTGVQFVESLLSNWKSLWNDQ